MASPDVGARLSVAPSFPVPPPVSKPVPLRLAQASFAAVVVMAAAAVSGGDGTAAAGAPLVLDVDGGAVRAVARVVRRDAARARRALGAGVVMVTDELVELMVGDPRAAFDAGGSGKPLLIEASVPPWADPVIVWTVVVRACNVCRRVAPWVVVVPVEDVLALHERLGLLYG